MSLTIGQNLGETSAAPEFGLYVHIPFCHAICHYCDFAKTANFDGALSKAYLARLVEQLMLMAPHLNSPFTSVFFGGGTPGLFASEYRPFMDVLRPLLAPGAEISLEANPANVTADHLAVWRELGFNRVSIGVQTFDPVGLKFLTRDHGAEDAVAAVERALTFFENVNLDLIYGWQGQDLESWRRDIAKATSLKVPHLSLYNLTYEPRTAIGRAFHRGKIPGADDASLVEYYEAARSLLAAKRYDHEEVSNWSLPGYSCRHNWIYWSGGHFAALGSGAHGYLSDGSNLGVRYAFPGDFRKYLRLAMPGLQKGSLIETVAALGAEFDGGRDDESALTEYVGGALRTCEGVSLARISKIISRPFTPRPALIRGISEKMVLVDGDRLRLHPAEWFRENAWAVEVILSCS